MQAYCYSTLRSSGRLRRPHTFDVEWQLPGIEPGKPKDRNRCTTNIEIRQATDCRGSEAGVYVGRLSATSGLMAGASTLQLALADKWIKPQ